MGNSETIETKRPHVALLVETSLASGRDILRGIAKYVRTHGSWALYHEAHGLDDSLPRWFKGWKGDGIIARLQDPAIAKAISRMGLPTVDVLGLVKDTSFPLVHVDDAKIAQTAAEHLLERGFRRFGYFGIQGESWSERRRDAFAHLVQEAGCKLSVFELPASRRTGRSWESMETELADWVASLGKPCGVMVCSDQRGARMLEACRRARVLVPDEVAVIGVDDDDPLCDVCNPSLSSIRPNHFQVGFEAAALLDRMMQGEAPPRKPTFVEPSGISTRLSSDVLAIEDRQIATVLRAIRNHEGTDIRVDDLARLAGFSRSVLQRRFRATMGRSVHQEILRIRIQRAQALLVETEIPLAEIAERTGFRHQEYMGSVFKSRLGKTPGTIRREAEGQGLPHS
jgi:LacI family transcriptional regulator